jgi:hypothetical protein
VVSPVVVANNNNRTTTARQSPPPRTPLIQFPFDPLVHTPPRTGCVLPGAAAAPMPEDLPSSTSSNSTTVVRDDVDDPPPPRSSSSSSTISSLAVRYQELGLGRLTRRVSQRRQSSLVNHLRSIYLDAQVR